MSEVNVEYGKELSILFSGIIIPSPLIMGSTPIEILCNKYCAPYNVERHIIGLHHGFICLSLYLCYYVIVSHSSSLNPPYHWILPNMEYLEETCFMKGMMERKKNSVSLNFHFRCINLLPKPSFYLWLTILWMNLRWKNLCAFMESSSIDSLCLFLCERPFLLFQILPSSLNLFFVSCNVQRCVVQLA